MRPSFFFFLLFFLLSSSISTVNAKYKMGGKKGPVKSSDQKRKAQKERSGKGEISHIRPGSETDKNVIERLSRRYDIKPGRLEYLRKINQDYDEIVPALIVARESNVEVEDIVKLRMDGHSWHDIAAKSDIKLKPLNKQVIEELEIINIMQTGQTETGPSNRLRGR